MRTFKEKTSNILKEKTIRNTKPSTQFFTNGLKTAVSGIYVSGSLLKEEAMNIKDLLSNPDLNDFKASEGWLDKWKLSYGIREKQISGESSDPSEVTVGSWMERFRELCKGYQLKDIWNMDESGCFLKALPSKGLAQLKEKCKGGKSQSKELQVLFC